MTIILIILLVLLLVLIFWMWNTLGSIKKATKIKYIISGVCIIYIFTFILHSISSIGINNENISAMKTIKNVYVVLFTNVNGYFILPIASKKIEQIKNGKLEKQKLKKYTLTLILVIAILTIIEINYFGNLQHRIIKNI